MPHMSIATRIAIAGAAAALEGEAVEAFMAAAAERGINDDLAERTWLWGKELEAASRVVSQVSKHPL